MRDMLRFALAALALPVAVASGLTVRTVGPGRNFTAVVDACAWLNANAIADDYEFVIDPGTYSGQCNLTAATGSYAVRFRPANPGTVVSITSSTQYVFSVSGRSCVKLDDLRLVSTYAGTGGNVVRMVNSAGSRLSGCTITTPPSANAWYGVYLSGAAADSIVNCGITVAGGGASYGVYAAATTAVVVKGCAVAATGSPTSPSAAVYVSAGGGHWFEGDTITGPWKYGIYTNGSTAANVYTLNRVYNSGVGAYGIHVYGGSDHVLSNNHIVDRSPGGDSFGIYIDDDSDRDKVFHNTIIMRNRAGAACLGAAHGSVRHEYRDNIFVCQANQYLYFMHGNSEFPLYASHNDLYNNGGTYLAIVGGTPLTLAQWQAKNGSPDVTGTITSDPLLRTDSLHILPASPARDAGASTTPAVLTDIDLETRPMRSAPDIGADELPPPPVITISAPAGGDVWRVGTSRSVVWSNTGGIDAVDSLWYTTNGGSNWVFMTGLTGPVNSWAWAVPSMPSTNCRIRVKADNAGGNDDDTSAQFTLAYDDVRTTAIISPAGTVDSGAIVEPRVAVLNAGNVAASFPVTLHIGSTYAQTVSGVSLAPNQVDTVEFPSWAARPPGGHSVTAFTALAGDMNRSNDTTRSTVTVRIPPYFDVRTTAIISPAGTVDSGAVVEPRVAVLNAGNVAASFPVTLHIGSTYAQTISGVSLAPNQVDTVEFPSWAARPPGDYNVTAFTALAGDMNRSNDTTRSMVTVRIPPSIDVGVELIQQPVGDYEQGSEVTPVANWRNTGSVPVGFTACCLLVDPSDSAVYAMTRWVASLAPGESTQIEFPAYNVGTAVGSWTVRCSTAAPGDANPDNDTMVGWFQVTPEPGRNGGWLERKSLPLEPSGKTVKDGGWLTWDAGRGLLYVAKGNKTGDFYSYNPAEDAWQSLATMPTGAETKQPYKGAVGASDNAGHVYATKGNNTSGFWKYCCEGDSWSQLPDVPLGATNKRVKGGSDMVYVDRGDSQYVYLLKGYRTEFWRYNTATGVWQALPDAPAGALPKWDKGSWLAWDGAAALYAHKAKKHEMYAFDLAAQVWGPALEGVPMVSRQTGKSKKAKDGSDGTCMDGAIYAFKGGNTQDFYAFDVAGQVWTERETIPAFGSTAKKKRVKAGGSLASDGAMLYALKGNKTLELWRYDLGTGPVQAAPPRVGAQAGTAVPTASLPRLEDCRPNPFSTRTMLAYELEQAGRVSLVVYDASGRAVRVLKSGAQEAGRHVAGWDGRDTNGRLVPNGVYLVRLDTPGGREVKVAVVTR